MTAHDEVYAEQEVFAEGAVPLNGSGPEPEVNPVERAETVIVMQGRTIAILQQRVFELEMQIIDLMSALALAQQERP